MTLGRGVEGTAGGKNRETVTALTAVKT